MMVRFRFTIYLIQRFENHSIHCQENKITKLKPSKNQYRSDHLQASDFI